ncbi:MAG TPA: hypothetical protein DCL35_03155 [Candidatus Omnitrophica bacterium]|nr:hypothetical protein [Candidatus Omnitrophota bacterium]
MSLLYLVDGYNALIGGGFSKNSDMKNDRAAFLDLIELNRPHGSVRNRLVVVFDGSPGVFGGVQNHSFEVVFTSGQTADDRIKEIVEASGRPKDIVVVTDDKGISSFVRPYGVKVLSVSGFLQKKRGGGRSKRQGAAAEKTDAGAYINIVERQAITKELEGIWLKKK